MVWTEANKSFNYVTKPLSPDVLLCEQTHNKYDLRPKALQSSYLSLFAFIIRLVACEYWYVKDKKEGIINVHTAVQ